MRGEFLLGLGLRLLSIFLIIGPILLAFSANNWDLKKTLLEENGVKEVEDKLSGLNFENIEWSVDETQIQYSEHTRIARIPISIYSRLSFSFTLQELEVQVTYDGRQSMFRMEEENVEIVPNENVTFHLTGVAAEDPRGKTIETDVKRLVIEKLGVRLDIRPEG